LALRLEPLVSAKAKARMMAGKKIDPTPILAQGEARDEIATAAGVSRNLFGRILRNKRGIIAPPCKKISITYYTVNPGYKNG